MRAARHFTALRSRILLRELLLALLPLTITVLLLGVALAPNNQALINRPQDGWTPYAYQGLSQDVLRYQVARLDPTLNEQQRLDVRDQVLSSVRSRAQFSHLSAVEAHGEGSLAAIERNLMQNTDESIRQAVQEALALSSEAFEYSQHVRKQYVQALERMRDALLSSAVVAGMLGLILTLRALLMWRADRVRAEQREARQQEALSLASHEMRRPLQSLLLASDLLRQAATEGQRQQLLTMIEDSAAQLASRADLTRLNALYLDVTLRVRRTDLIPLVRRFASARVHVVTPGSPLFWPVDADRTRQILENLIENAVKYTDGVVEVTLDAPNGAPRIRVRDFGPGMSDDLRGRVFLPFERGPQSLVAGSGLGLPLVRRYARAHGGDVCIAQAPEGGLVVTVTFGEAQEQIAAASGARAST